MAAVAARVREEDPIQEDETDTVVARMNIKKPWTRVSSPPRRLQASSTSQNSKLGQANSLPPHIRGSRSYTAKGTPIILRRPIQDSELGDEPFNNMKANDGSKFGAFKPRNNLARRATGHSHIRTIDTSLPLKSATRDRTNQKRKHNELAVVSDEEDELAGPGVNDRNSSSPSKKRRASVSRQSSVEEYQRVERIVSPPNGLSPHHKTSATGNIDLSSLRGETEKQKRERKRQQTVSRHQRSQKRQSGVTSPYFASVQELRNEQISSPSKSDALRNYSSKPSPTTRAEGLQECLGTHDVFLDEHSQNAKEIEEQIIESPLTRKNQSSIQTMQEHREATRHGLLRKHEKCWPIKGFFTDKNNYEHGSMELVVDKKTKTLSLRIDDQLRSERFLMDKIFEARFSESLIRLHFRGPAVIIWIRSRGNAETLIAELKEIYNFKRQPETNKRAEQMFDRWARQCKDQSSSPTKKTVEDVLVTPRRFSPSDQVPTLTDRKRVSLQQDLVKSDQNEDTPKPKRLKLNERLQASQTKAQGDPATPTPARNSTKAAIKVANIPYVGSERSSRLGEESREFSMDHNSADPLESFGKDTARNARLRSRSPVHPKESSGEDKDSVLALAKRDSRDLTRPIRTTRAKRSYANLDEFEMPSVVKYSKIHGLGPRWTEPLIWPRNGKKRVTVEFDDLERLDEGEFLNDSLVEFALRWLRQETHDPPNIYWFNTYFFEKISKGKGRQIDYNGVKKWTKDVDIFSYDYVVVPINENYHWYLAIICNLPQLKRNFEVKRTNSNSEPTIENAEDSGDSDESADLELLTRSIKLTSPRTPLHGNKPMLNRSASALINSDANEKTPKGKPSSGTRGRTRDPLSPTIVTLDSLDASHPQAIATLKLYLKEEAQERLGISWEKDDIVGMTAKGIPCQSNLSDCGLYLLGYVATMLPDPSDFISKLLLKEFDMEKDWDALEPSQLRTNLRKIIQKKHRTQIKRAERNGHGKTISNETSSDMSSDDIQLLGPGNPTREANHEIPTALIPSPLMAEGQRSEKAPPVNDVLDEADVQIHTNFLQSKNHDHEQVTAHEETTTTSDTHPILVQTYQEPTDVQESFEVPETPQTSPGPELPTRASTPDAAPLDENDKQLIAQSTSPVSSFGSTLRDYLKHS